MSVPVNRFRQWLAHARNAEDFTEACCLSTIGLDGWPNARYVALKDVTRRGFVVAGPLDSRKGQELQRIPRAALTFWWPEVSQQVRIQGEARPIDGPAADRIFAQRDRSAQLLAWASRQGRPLTSNRDLEARLRHFDERFRDGSIQRPPTWGGFCIDPIRIEFLAFREDRMHERVEYHRPAGVWVEERLQP